MATLIAETKNTEQLIAVEAVLKLLKVSFRKAEDSPYPEFVEKILRMEKELKLKHQICGNNLYSSGN